MAAERGNAALAGLLDAARAPVLALIADVVEAAEAHGRWVGVCGELAGEPDAAVLLAGLGVRELSMAAEQDPGRQGRAARERHGGRRGRRPPRPPPATAPPRQRAVESRALSWQRRS